MPYPQIWPHISRHVTQREKCIWSFFLILAKYIK